MALLRALVGWKIASVLAVVLVMSVLFVVQWVPAPLLGLAAGAVGVFVVVLAAGVLWATRTH